MTKLLVLLCLLGATSLHAQSLNDPYDFPVKPGTEAWKKLGSGKEMAEACQLPTSVLTALSTEALAKTCLNYPLLFEVLSVNSVVDGMERTIANFNGLTELVKRKDAGAVLANLYKQKDARTLSGKLTDAQVGALTFEYTYLELLLAHPLVLNSLDSRERTELIKGTILLHDTKKAKVDVFGEFGVTTAVFLLAKIMQAEGKLEVLQKSEAKGAIDTFLKTAMYSDPSILSTIYSAAKSL